MKKECGFFRDKLADFAMNEMDAEPELKKKIDEHVSICTDCWKVVDAYRKAAETAASVMRVEFSDDVWEMQRREIIKKATHKADVLGALRKSLGSFLITRKLAAGFALAVMVAAGAGAAYKYNSYRQEIRAEKTIISRLDMLENMEIIERLEFYKKISEAKGLL